MNTAARLESTGQKNRIHVSKDTAEILKQSNKGQWLSRREDTVFAKGKGELETFWLTVQNSDAFTEKTSRSESTKEQTEKVEEDPDDREEQTRLEDLIGEATASLRRGARVTA